MQNEVVEVNNNVPVIADDTLVSLAEQAEKRVDALNKIKRAALKATNPRDWTDQNGNPYLQVSGSEKVGRVFGMSWRIEEPKYETEEGGHFSFTYKGEFSLAGATIEVIGTRSSKDPFFKKYKGKGDDRVELPPSEIDKTDVKKAALTNLFGNGITRMLGLRNLTWDDLKEFAGITRDQVGRVDYKKNGRTQSDIKNEGDQASAFVPADIRKQTGKNQKTGKDWTKFIIKSPGGSDYVTFSETFANTAKEAKDAGRQVEVTFKAGQYGNDVSNVRFADEGPQDREPGAEG